MSQYSVLAGKDWYLGKMKAKKLSLLLALLTTAIFLIYARYELRVEQMKMNLDTGKGFVLIMQCKPCWTFQIITKRERTVFVFFIIIPISP